MGKLITHISSTENLRAAVEKVRATHPFLQDRKWLETDVEGKLANLQKDLATGKFIPGSVEFFYSFDEKKLRCVKLDLRCVVAMEAICLPLKAVLEKGAVDNCSYSIDKIEQIFQACKCWKRSCVWALKADIARFFDSVEHRLLFQTISASINCDNTLHLLKNLFASFDEAGALFSVKSPEYNHRAGFSLPAGHELVYVLANAFLKPIDQKMSVLTNGRMARYLDDYLFFGEDQSEMEALLANLQDNLQHYGLVLNPEKSFIRPCRYPISFLRQPL